jgi:hypothetical protein
MRQEFSKRLVGILQTQLSQDNSLNQTNPVIGSIAREMLKECKTERFPICLERALITIFKDKELIFHSAFKAGYVASEISMSRDIWQSYIKFISVLRKQLGSDVVAVIESEVINQIESLGCTQCPVYQLESKRKKFAFKLDLLEI